MASSPEFALLLDLGLTIISALGFSLLFSKLKQLPIIAVLAVAILGKFVGAWMGARMSFARNDAVKVGTSMLPRGEFSFVVAREGTGLGIAGQLLLPIAGLSTLISSIAASVGLRLARA